MAKYLLKSESTFSRLTKPKIYTSLRRFLKPSYTIILAHMPKAAGISLNTIMKKQYGIKRVLEVDPTKPRKAYLDAVDMSIWTALRLRAISGHIIWDIHEWLPKPYVYMTVLRDPVERVLSFYSYVRASFEHRLHNEMIDKNMDLEEFLEWDKSMLELNNLQSKLLSSMHPFRESDLSVVFERAKSNLETYFLVGLTEQFERSLEMFSCAFGWKNPQIERANITPNRVKRSDVSHRVIRKIELLNEYDMELYEIGNRLFGEQLVAPRSAFRQKLRL